MPKCTAARFGITDTGWGGSREFIRWHAGRQSAVQTVVRFGSRKILCGRHFLNLSLAKAGNDIDRCGYRTLEQTLNVLGQLKVPAHMIVAEQDEYVRLADVERARAAVPAGSELLMMGGMSHEVGRSLRAARVATTALTSYCRKAVGLSGEASSAPFTDVIKFSGAETEFLSRFDAAGVERGAA